MGLLVHCHTQCVLQRSEDNLQKWVLSFHDVSLRGQIWVISLGSKCLYLLNYFADPQIFLNLKKLNHFTGHSSEQLRPVLQGPYS